MDVSILISTWNNAERLAKTLANLTSCDIPDGLAWEIVLVKNNCTDQTDEVARRFSSRLPLLVVDEPKQGLSRARNRGLRAATGQFVLFTDDDIRPCEGWIRTYWENFKEMGAGYFFGGPVESEFEVPLQTNGYLKYAPPSVKGITWGDTARELAPDDPVFISANWGAPLPKIMEIGGFDEAKGLNAIPNRITLGEETDLMIRLRAAGLKPWYLPDAGIYHFVPKEKAHKKHIIRRWRASMYGWGRYGPDHDMERVPDWMYKVLIRYCFAWLKHLRREDAVDKYMEMIAMYERINGVRDRIKIRNQSYLHNPIKV